MKYVSLSILSFVFVLLVTSVSFAGLTYSDTETLTCGNTAGKTVDVPLSPGVTAGYDVGDWKGTNDWFVVGAYHNAGSKVYATASSLSEMMEGTVGEGDPLVDKFDAIPNTYATAGSTEVWSNAGWDN